MSKQHPEGTEYHAVRSHNLKGAHSYLQRAGYATGGKVHDDGEPDMDAPGLPHKKSGGKVDASEKEFVKKEIHKHEKHDHKGKKLTKLKDGGHVEGHKAKPRADRYARGGATKHKGEKGNKVNIIVAPGENKGAGDPRAAQMQAAMMAQQKPAGVNPAAMAPSPIPPGASMPPAARPPMAARGGKIKDGFSAGSRTGEGRLEKIKKESGLMRARKHGGECD